jgi:hypothetical protein
MSASTSDFGQGLVYNIALWCCHISNPQAEQIRSRHFILQKPEGERELILSDNPPDSLNYGKKNKELKWWFESIVPIYGTPEKALSSDISMWANGASDHFYDVQIPEAWKKKAIGKHIAELADKALDMGHGYKDVVYTYDDFKELLVLTKKVCLGIDKELGVKTIKAQWGEL